MRRLLLVRTGALFAMVALLQPALAESEDWARWVRNQIAGLPASQTIDAALEKAREESRAMAQPLYNPALNLGYENAAETARTMGLSQTLDWSGKARSAGRVGQAFDQTARLQTEKIRARLTADALSALVAYDAAQTRLTAAGRQEQYLVAFNDLVSRREASGDLGRIDAQLAYLSLARAQQTLAEAESGVIEAGTELKTVLAMDEPALALPPPTLWQTPDMAAASEKHVVDHYDYRLAEAALSLAESNVELVQKQRRTDPTLGLDVGREGSDTLWALKFSMPLPVRNTGKPEYRAALAETDRRQFELARTRNNIQARLDGRLTNYRAQLTRWQRWQQLAEDTLNESNDLLEHTWRQGELTTQDYLQALEQRLQTRLAGVALRVAMQQAWVEWLFESAQLDRWLDALANVSTPQRRR